MSLTVEDILNGTRTGRMQSVGHMGVIPILDDGAEDESFAPPDLDINTSHYGTVNVRNRSTDRPTIVPTGAGWVVQQAAQDHAIPGAKFVGPGKQETIDVAMCIQQSQGGTIRDGQYDLLVLPAPLRAKALSMRKEKGYSKLRGPIEEFNTSVSAGRGRGGHLEYFLNQYKDELDQFVAQFELVPGQVGAIVLLDGTVVGIERAPNKDFWTKVWEPLIRVCYGALAIKARQKLGDRPPKHRVPFQVGVKSLAGIGRALDEARERADQITGETYNEVKRQELAAGQGSDDKHGRYTLMTVANRELAGQVVLKGTSPQPSYVSICAAGA